jgi:hypothetical protein
MLYVPSTILEISLVLPGEFTPINTHLYVSFYLFIEMKNSIFLIEFIIILFDVLSFLDHYVHS